MKRRKRAVNRLRIRMFEVEEEGVSVTRGLDDILSYRRQKLEDLDRQREDAWRRYYLTRPRDRGPIADEILDLLEKQRLLLSGPILPGSRLY